MRLAAADLRLLPGPPWARGLLVVLLVWGAVLRMLGWPSIPFSHDEISALVRLYPTLGETIRRGVIELDTHPPGVQVLEWLWTGLVGRGEGLVQLPFIAASLAGILFMYRFALAWTGASAALAVAALMATLQYTVLYGQYARPYAIGLATAALLADQATRWLACHRTKHLVAAAIAATLCAFTHHFAALVAALIMAGTLVVAVSGRRGNWLLACAASLLLYTPNIPILVHQFGLGGLQEWLAPPDGYWFADHVWWIVHASPGMALITTVVVTASLAGWWRHRRSALPIVPLLLLWTVVPATLGFAYSVWRAPVLQHSVLVFAFPFALTLLLGGLRAERPLLGMLPALVLAVSATISLFTSRQHHLTALTSKYEAFMQAAVDGAAHGDRMVVLDAPPEVLDLMERQPRFAAARGRYVRLRSLPGQAALLDSLRRGRPSEVVLGLFHSTDRALPTLVQHTHPVLAARTDLVEGQVMRFIRTGQGIVDTAVWALTTPDAPASGWQVEPPATGPDSLGPRGWDLTGRAYGVLFDAALPAERTCNDVLELVLDATLMDEGGAAIEAVIELRTRMTDGRDTTVVYRGASAASCGLHAGQRGPVAVALPISRALLRKGALHLRAYAWNRSSGAVRVHAAQLRWREGNPALYGLVEPVHGVWRFAPARH